MKLHPIFYAGALLFVGLVLLFMFGVVPESNLLNWLVGAVAPLLGVIGLVLTVILAIRRR